MTYQIHNDFLWQIYNKLGRKPKVSICINNSLNVNDSKKFQEYIDSVDKHFYYLLHRFIIPQMLPSASNDLNSIINVQIIKLGRSKVDIPRRSYSNIIQSLTDNNYLQHLSRGEYIVSRNLINGITDNQWSYITELYKQEYVKRQIKILDKPQPL